MPRDAMPDGLRSALASLVRDLMFGLESLWIEWEYERLRDWEEEP